MTTETNPLLDLHPERPVPFARIAGEHIEPAIQTLLARSYAGLAALESSTGPRTYDNTLRALELLTEELDFAMSVISHLESVATTPAIREAFAAVQPAVSELGSRIALSEGIYRVLTELAKSDEASRLGPVERRFLDKTLASFRRHGAELPKEGKERLLAMDVELGRLTLKFSQNVLDATNAYELLLPDASRLAGLPESALGMLRASAEDKGLSGYRVTLAAPSYMAVVTFADDADLRREVYRAFNARAASGPFDNRALLQSILELRREKAELLGYASFADLVLEDRMAKNGPAARAFLATVREKAAAAARREHTELEAFAREMGATAPLEPSDVAYWAEKLRKARFDFDDEMLRPYLPLDRALAGAFDIVSRLYGVRIEPAPELTTWDPSVTCHHLVEPDGRTGAVFYVDVFPRENKRDGAWMHGLWTAVPGEVGKNVEILAGNFTPPTSERPALLNHRELETLFHELGHLMHHAASRVPVRSLGGTAVAWDFVELPSQIMENWCWEKAALDLFARHYQTGEPVPEALVTRMRKARTFRAATMAMRQLGFAELDLSLHMEWDPRQGGDAVAHARRILSEHSPLPLPEEHALLASFSHLFSSPVGYAAGYYSYKWAEVLEADAFGRFAHEGLFDPSLGRAFREGVLARGDSEDPAVLVREFLGREPRIDALLERDGLLTPEAA